MVHIQQLWQNFAERHQLTEQQLKQFQTYYQMVVAANQLFNITAIEELNSFLAYHFDDSLQLGKEIDLTQVQCIADIGTGAGFPAIPLKIKYPHLKLVLIEVTHKKLDFLAEVCTTLGLSDVELSSYDWRNFLRKTTYAIDIFCARASLQPEELVRLFKATSPYKEATLIYWAALDWQAQKKEQPFLAAERPYKVGNKRRKLVFFKNPLSTTVSH